MNAIPIHTVHIKLHCNQILCLLLHEESLDGDRELVIIVDSGSTTLAATGWGVSCITCVIINVRTLNRPVHFERWP